MGQAQVAEWQRHATELEHERAAHTGRLTDIKAQIVAAQQELVPYTDELVFQQAGVFRYHHPLENAEAYRNRLALVSAARKT